MDGNFLKLYHIFFEKSQEKYNSLDCQYFFGVGSIDAKFKCSTFDANQNSFSCLKHTNLKIDDLCFLNVHFKN